MQDVNTMDAEQLQAIRERVEAATPGEWTAENWDAEEGFRPEDDEFENAWYVRGMKIIVCGDNGFYTEEDATFIAYAPDDIRALLDAHDALMAENTRLRAALDEEETYAVQLECEIRDLMPTARLDEYDELLSTARQQAHISVQARTDTDA